MAELLKTSVPGYTMSMGTATLSTDDDADLASVTIKTGMTTVLSATAILTEAPSGVSTPVLYRTISGDAVTFYCGNVDGVGIDYQIRGLV